MCTGLGRANLPLRYVGIARSCSFSSWSTAPSCVTRSRTSSTAEDQQSRLLQETEHDYVALASAGAEAARLETMLERADREATEREVDLEAILVRQLRELVAAVAARLPAA